MSYSQAFALVLIGLVVLAVLMVATDWLAQRWQQRRCDRETDRLMRVGMRGLHEERQRERNLALELLLDGIHADTVAYRRRQLRLVSNAPLPFPRLIDRVGGGRQIHLTNDGDSAA